jgi:hypothetical protein
MRWMIIRPGFPLAPLADRCSCERLQTVHPLRRSQCKPSLLGPSGTAHSQTYKTFALKKSLDAQSLTPRVSAPSPLSTHAGQVSAVETATPSSRKRSRLTTAWSCKRAASGASGQDRRVHWAVARPGSRGRAARAVNRRGGVRGLIPRRPRGDKPRRAEPGQIEPSGGGAAGQLKPERSSSCQA